MYNSYLLHHIKETKVHIFIFWCIDPDMLEVGNGGMTTEEYRAHFSIWALAKVTCNKKFNTCCLDISI